MLIAFVFKCIRDRKIQNQQSAMFVINFPVKEKTIVRHVDILNDYELHVDDNFDSLDQ